LSQRYQDATNYTPESVQGHPGLDFRTQPAAFKTWHQARRVVLEGGPSRPRAPEPGPLDAARLGTLLYHTYGVTLVREFPGMSLRFRAAPSAGALYPAELYVAVRDLRGIPDGLFAYDARDHSLVVCWEGDFGPALERYAFGHPAVGQARAVLVGTGLYERSVWRYGARGYRRVLLDSGHVFGNAVLAAVPDGLRCVPLADFVDEGVQDLLLLDDRCEGVTLLAPVVEAHAPIGPAPAPRRAQVARGRGEPQDGAWIPALHRAGKLALDAPAAQEEARPVPGPAAVGATVPLASEPLAGGPGVLHAIRRRRSTRAYASTDVPREVLGRVLAHAHPRPGGPDPEADLAPGVLDTWVAVAGVKDLEPGIYRYDTGAHALVPVLRGSPRAVLHQCCLWQELGRDCAFAVLHTLDLAAGVRSHGERVYRTAHLQAGLVGQRLNLAALRLGYGASGIGGFFDDFLRALLRLGPDHAVVYVTTVGSPA
jgi:SagB-type dehydrogenase family enzyme